MKHPLNDEDAEMKLVLKVIVLISFINLMVITAVLILVKDF
jgi:hypothetical protein